MEESQRKRKLDEILNHQVEELKEEAKTIKTKLVRSNSGSFRCSYSEDFETKAINLCNAKGVSLVASQLGIAESVLFKWVKYGPVKRGKQGRKPSFQELESALFEWFYKQREDSILFQLKY